jgi:hypothetical protein
MAREKIPFFVLGMGRTGSTYLYHLLDKHPRVALTNEARAFDFIYFLYRAATLRHGESVETSDVFGVNRIQGIMEPPFNIQLRSVMLGHVPRILEEFYDGLFPGKEYTRFGDKLPSVNAALEYRLVDPRTLYLSLVRDPRDVAVSVRQVRWPLTLEQCCTMWCTIYDRLRQVSDAHLVRYEDLVRDPQGVAAGVLRHLGLDPAERQAGDPKEAAVFAHHGTSATPEASIGRWQQELDAAEARLVTERCGELMRVYGYA